MGYSNFKRLNQITTKFNVQTRFVSLFPSVLDVQPSDWLLQSLDFAYLGLLMNEKAKSERLVSPILIEVLKKYADKISFFSGEDLNVHAEDDLYGECDFSFALHPPKLYTDAPIISLVKTKYEDMEWSIAQCAAQMFGARIFNDAERKPTSVIYGCVTNGTIWQFIKFENNCFYVDKTAMTDLAQILGTWHHIVQFFLKNYSKI